MHQFEQLKTYSQTFANYHHFIKNESISCFQPIPIGLVSNPDFSIFYQSAVIDQMCAVGLKIRHNSRIKMA